MLEYVIKFGFKATNNEVKYEALVSDLKIVNELGVRKITLRSDSKLVVYQVLGKYKARED